MQIYTFTKMRKQNRIFHLTGVWELVVRPHAISMKL